MIGSGKTTLLAYLENWFHDRGGNIDNPKIWATIDRIERIIKDADTQNSTND